MTEDKIKGIIAKLGALHFPMTDDMRKQLFSITFRMDCAKYATGVLASVDVAQINHFTDMNKKGPTPGIYEIETDSTRLICRAGSDVAFHFKRLALETLVSLDNSVDVIWDSLQLIYKPDPAFKKTPFRSALVSLIANTPSQLSIGKFVKDNFETNADAIRAINWLRNEFTHNDYLIRSDIKSEIKEIAYEQYECQGRATFNFTDSASDLNLKLSETDREYKVFCQNSLTLVNKMFEDYLMSMVADLRAQNIAPITYNYIQP